MNDIDFDTELPEPWHWENIDFEVNLYRTLCKGHVLERKTVKTIAKRQDMDVVLFSVADSEYGYAVVHLTHQKETNPKWPITMLYKVWKDVYEKEILPDSIDFNS